jgi:serine/threonine-protein kinase
VGQAADIYALGVILFEILSLTPMHRGDSVDAVIASSLASGGVRPSERAPHLEVGPELDRICTEATALVPEERFRSAREMQEAIEQYLDGERNAELRSELARRHVRRAAEVFELAASAGPAGEADRARGLRELGAALALDPSNAEVLRTLLGIVFDGREDLPPEAEAELREYEGRDRARGARDGMLAYGFMAVGTPVLLMMPVLRPALFVFLGCAVAATAAYNMWMWRTGNAGRRYMARLLPMAFLVVGLTSSLFGPFVMVPGTAAVTVASLLVNLRANTAARQATLLLGLASVLVPMALQLAGVVPPSYVFEPGSIRIVSNLVEFRPLPAFLMLATGSVVTVVATVFAVGRAVETLVRSERRNFAQAWRLRQMLPRGTTASIIGGVGGTQPAP